MQPKTRPFISACDEGNGRIIYQAGRNYEGYTLNAQLISPTVELTGRGIMVDGHASLDFGQPLPAEYELKLSLRKPKPTPADD